MEFKQIHTLLTRLRCRFSSPACVQSRFCSGGVPTHTSEKHTELSDFVFPPRIERGPTDILRALSSTVSRDVIGPHYKYHDDPYLIPTSNVGKRTFALAKEAGRKSAQWIHKKHGDLFDTTLANPPILAFNPPVLYTEDSKVSEEVLNQLIKEFRVSDASTVFDLLEKQGTKLSLETLQNLLELLAFYNSEDPLPADLVEERWLRQSSSKDRSRKPWKLGGPAETVYEKMTPLLEGNTSATIKAKSALLRGMAKYGQATKVWELYQIMREKGELVDTETFNGVLRSTIFLRDGNEARWQFLEERLHDMVSLKLKPNLETLNSCLEVISTMHAWRQVRTITLRLLADFKQIGITPSLASYYYLLNVFCRERGPTSLILEEILSELEQQNSPLTIRDKKDTFFFVTAMDVCKHHLGNPSLARRVHQLLLAYDNYDLIGDSFKESIYYRHLYSLICNMEPLDSFMELYNKYTPHIYIPEPSVMEEIVQSIFLHEAWHELPRIWSDIFIFDQMERTSLVTLWLEAAVAANAKLEKPPTAEEPATGLVADFCKSVKQLWDKIEGQSADRMNPARWTGTMLGFVMRIAVRAYDVQFACQALDKLQGDIGASAPPGVESLQEFIALAVALKNSDMAVACVEFAIDSGFAEAAKMASELREKMELNEQQISRISNMTLV